MLHIRVVKTASGSRAVQLVYYQCRKRFIYKHIGSACTDEELDVLKEAAQDLIESHTPSLPLFQGASSCNLLYLDKSEFLGVYYTFFYEVICNLISKIGFDRIVQELLRDLIVIRIFEPASKSRSIELLEVHFGLKHRRQSFYKFAPCWLKLKSDVEAITVQFARDNYGFNYDLLFYDVTTLYFESFEEDSLRRNGFSKDNKSQQPQILVALMVTSDGFPIAYDVFAGNTFEGHTILPVVKAFIKKYTVKHFTVVADAAMISEPNVRQLLENQINYIVGARLGNLPNKLMKEIDRAITREDNNSIRIKTGNGYLICSYSSVRYRKDKHEMEKQIEKAKAVVKDPSKGKKLKFTRTNNNKIELNEALIQKTEKLLGIKGYYTNLEEKQADNRTIINRYGELYKIEQAFRISKSDLQTRPVFHYKEEPIKLHILICFMALVISKHVELSTGNSIKKFITEAKKITDARMLDLITNKEIRIRTRLSKEMVDFLTKLNLSH